MKRLLTLTSFSLLLSVYSSLAQNGVRIAAATGTADPSAMLDVVSATKGFLVPRMNLTGPALTNPAPVTSPATGLLVYNLGGGGIAAVGFYYWTGTAWVQLSAGALSGSGTVNYVAKWTTTSAIGNSQIYDNGTNVGVGTSSPTQKLNVGAGNNDGILIGNYNDQLGWNGTGTAPEYSIRFSGYRDVVSNFIGAKISAIRSNLCCSGLSQGMELSFLTQETTATGAGDANLIERMRIGAGGNVKITNLSSNGIRPVYAHTNGTVKPAYIFHCTGADQTWVCPAGVTSITVKMWGAGGGSGNIGGWTRGWDGGGGGYSTGTIAVTPGSTYYIIVGKGGNGGEFGQFASSYGGGGRNCASADCRYSGAGGGRSAFRAAVGGPDLMTAGGGGGGGCTNGTYTPAHRGGAGGGATGQNGENATNGSPYFGFGGTQVAGGAGAAGASRTGSAGTQYQGGIVSGTESYGGGGGGGWWGGGGGGYHSYMSGGGGGSGYISGAGVSAGTTTVGNYDIPANVSDPNYLPGVGVGGRGGSGGNGMVVIIPN